MRAAVIVFPGSNCDRDVVHSLQTTVGAKTERVWHESQDLPGNVDLVVLPGGFSYGDYLRCGAMAARTPIMNSVRRFAEGGGLVLGICNGFQVLTELRLLPGAILANNSLTFICKRCTVRVEQTDTPFTLCCRPGQVLDMPIAHHEGLYFLPEMDLQRLREENRVVFRYCAPEGTLGASSNPNGAVDHIAGIVNERGNILGLMPHPERASEKILGSEDGTFIWESLRTWLEKGGRRK
ncbi:MAG: phosphoribosylformylglycinamidine synthase subunit PurQ [Thermovirgaceae bacterium]